jgi:putative transposase
VFSESTTIGVDLGIIDFAVMSTGEKVENPKWLEISLKRLKVL